MEENRFPCPNGCGRTFKTNSAAYAHRVHCKHEPEVKPEVEGDVDQGSDGLSLEGKLILERLSDVAVAQIQEGLGGLQERVQTSVVEGVAEVLPRMVAEQVDKMAGKIVEMMKSNPNTNILGSLDGINQFLATPLGQILQKKFLAGSVPKGNINQWRQGAQLATKMITSNKGDPEATAAAIREFAKPYSGKAGSDLFRAMHDVADMFKPTSPKTEERTFKVTGSKTGGEQE